MAKEENDKTEKPQNIPIVISALEARERLTYMIMNELPIEQLYDVFNLIVGYSQSDVRLLKIQDTEYFFCQSQRYPPDKI